MFRGQCLIHFTGVSFKSFVDLYKSTYVQRHQDIKDRLQKIGKGLEKIEEALLCVSELKNVLAEKEQVLAAETAKTEDALKLVCFFTYHLLHLFFRCPFSLSSCLFWSFFHLKLLKFLIFFFGGGGLLSYRRCCQSNEVTSVR